MNVISKSKEIECFKNTTLMDVVLNNDGSVMQLLSSIFNEVITTEVLQQKYCRISHEQWDDINENEGVLKRSVFLKGNNSNRRYVYASSLIRIDKLPDNFADDLMNKRLGIGEIIKKHNIEIFRKITDISIIDSHIMHSMFSVKGDISCRTYKIYINKAAAMLITEYYPNEFFNII